MRFIFRADASISSGSGHVARLLAIAEEALSRGIECIFVGDITEPIWLIHKIESLRISIIPVQNSQSLSVEKSDILFIDSYSLNPSDSFVCLEVWARTILMADSSTPALNSDEVFFIEDLPVPERFSRSIVHHGFSFFPLKKSISHTRPVSQQVRKIVVVGGGTDPFNFAGAISEVLHQIRGFESAIFFTNDLRSIQDLDSRFSVLDFGEGLDLELETTDLVLSTASTIALETLAKGLPLGVSCAVQNQRTFYDYLVSMNAAKPIGRRDKTSNWDLNILNIERLISDVDFRNGMRKNGLPIIDNRGSARVVDMVLSNLRL